jgi:hypothetical protein
MTKEITEAFVFPIDVACRKCECTRTVDASMADGGGYNIRDEASACACTHLWSDHEYVRDAKSDFEKGRDGEL